MTTSTASPPAPSLHDATRHGASHRALCTGIIALAASVTELSHYPYPCSTMRAHALRSHVVGVARAGVLLAAAMRSGAVCSASSLREGLFAAVYWAEELAAEPRDRRALRRLAATLQRLAGAVDALVSDELHGSGIVHDGRRGVGRDFLDDMSLRDATFVLPWLLSFADAADRAVLIAAMTPRERLQLWWCAGRYRSRAHLALG